MATERSSHERVYLWSGVRTRWINRANVGRQSDHQRDELACERARGRPTRAVISQTHGRSVPAAAAARVMDRSNSFRHESEGGEEIMIKISVGAAAADEEEDGKIRGKSR